MIAKPLAAITAAGIQRLVTERTPEGRSIEFKRELPGTKDSDRKEFLADVSSFANALGGDLIFGVEEKDGCAWHQRGAQAPILGSVAEGALHRSAVPVCVVR